MLTPTAYGNQWQTATPSGGQASLVTCVVSPGFDFADFTLAGTSS